MIGDAGLAASLFNKLANRGIVNMTDSWKEVMFYLKIEASQKPVQEFARRTEI